MLYKIHLLAELGMVAGVASMKQFGSFEDYRLRMAMCFLALIYVAMSAKLLKISKKDLGVNLSTFGPAFRQSLGATGMFLALLVVAKIIWPEAFRMGISYNSVAEATTKLLVYGTISVPIQELVFRGYLVSRLEQIVANKWLIIAVSAVIFGLIHLPFGSLALTIGSVGFGVYLGANFKSYRNIFSLMVVHIIVGIGMTILAVT